MKRFRFQNFYLRLTVKHTSPTRFLQTKNSRLIKPVPPRFYRHLLFNTNDLAVDDFSNFEIPIPDGIPASSKNHKFTEKVSLNRGSWHEPACAFIRL